MATDCAGVAAFIWIVLGMNALDISLGDINIQLWSLMQFMTEKHVHIIE